MLGCFSPHRQGQQSPCRGLGLVLWLLLFLLPLAVGGCYWIKYGKLMRTHIDLLLSMAKKMHDLLEDRQTITLAMMDEFSYPLERARDFRRIASQRYAGQRSLHAFSRFLDLYAELVHEVDRLRVVDGDVAGFHKRFATLQEHGAQVKAILAEEGWE